MDTPQKGFEFTMGFPGQSLRPKPPSLIGPFKDCADCLLLKQSIAELKKSLSSSEKKIKILQIQKSEFQKELSTYKNNYKDLKRNAENSEITELLKQKDAEIAFLNEELDRTQVLFQDLTCEYESFTLNMSHLTSIPECEEYEKALKAKNQIIEDQQQSLNKSQITIASLTHECENLHLQLSDVENTMCREEDLHIKSLSQELKIMKKKYKDLKGKKWEQSENHDFTIQNIIKEKLELETALEDLNKKFQELEKMSSIRVKDFYETYEKIQALEDVIEKKDKEMMGMKKMYEDFDIGRQLELESLKKSTQIFLGDAKNPKEAKIPFENHQTNLPKKNLKALVRDLVLQEALLRQGLYKIIDNETGKIGKVLRNMEDKVSGFRAEFEKWVMRNEELEQKLMMVEENNVSLIRVVQDLQKIIAIKDRQFDEVAKLYAEAGEELEERVRMLSEELGKRHEMVVGEVFPLSYKCLMDALSAIHMKYFKATRRN